MSDDNQCLLSRRKALKAVLASFAVTITQSVLALSNKDKKLEKEKMTINVIVSFEIKSEKITEFTKILISVKTDLPKVEGCISVDVFKSSSAENRFTLVETWQSKEFHQTHLNRLSNDGTWDMIASHLSKDPESDYYIQM